MSKPFVCRLAVAQILANPAYADELVSCIQEPDFPDGTEKVGLFTIAGLEPVNALRQQIALEYVDHLNRKLEAVTRFAAHEGVELLVFPEYSIPPESLPTCKRLSDELGISIVAGSHVVTVNVAAQQIYRSLGLLQDSELRAQPGERLRQALCVVFAPGRGPVGFAKSVRSKWETSLVPGKLADHSFEVPARSGRLEVQVLICLEALTGREVSREKHTHPRLIAIPAFTPSSDDFYDFGNLTLLQGKCSLFANVAEFGGSRVFVRAENAPFWFTENTGTHPLPTHAEALLVVEADLERQFEIRKLATQHAAVRDVAVFPLLYEVNSSETRQYVELLRATAARALTLDDLRNRLSSFTDLTARVFPKFLQEKLRHLVSHVLPSGMVDPVGAERWMQAVIISDTASTDVVRWDLCSRSMEIVNELLVSGRFVAQTKELLDVYGHLMRKRNELAEFVQREDKREPTPPKQTPLPSQGRAVETPFLDRDNAFDRIRTFINDDRDVGFVLSGMRGMGKTCLIQEAFRQVIPPTKKIWLQLTEGMSYLRLLAELAYSCNLQISEGFNLSASSVQHEMEQRVISTLCRASGAIIVLDEFQYLLNAGGEIEDSSVRQFLVAALEAGSTAKTKWFFISNIAPRLAPEIESQCSSHSLKGLLTRDTERLLQYWYQFGRETLTGALPIPSERFLSILGGHPLATKVAARLWAEHPSRELVDDISIFKELRDTIVSFVLEKLTPSEAEGDLLDFASIFRLPAPREVFVRWRGEEANYLLNSLAGQYLLESSEKGYQLHPLVRDYYYNSLGSSLAVQFHKIAGRFYIDLFEKLRRSTRELNPEYLGEAIHHFLAAGDKRRVQDFLFYKHELKPVALTHYRRRDFKMALADYKVLVELDKNDPDAHLHLALIFARERRWADAELHFGRAMELRPGAHWILQAYGSAMLNAGRLVEAEGYLTQAERANPSYPATLVDLGRLREKQQDDPGAEFYYKKAVDIDPDNAFALYSLARLLYRGGDVKEAYHFALAALASRPLDERNKALVNELRVKLINYDAELSGTSKGA